MESRRVLSLPALPPDRDLRPCTQRRSAGLCTRHPTAAGTPLRTARHGGPPELIVAVDDGTRRLAYSVIEGARPPADYHHASFEVCPEGDRASRLIWTTDVLPHALAARVRIIMERGGIEMKEAIEAAAPAAAHYGTRPGHESLPADK
jgi:hypothetical protein